MKKEKTSSKISYIFLLSGAAFLTTIGFSSWFLSSSIDVNYAYPEATDVTPKAYIVGQEANPFVKIESALRMAKSGDIVVLIPPKLPNYHPTNNPNNPDKVSYEITEDCTIKPGVSLVLPTDEDSVASVNDASSLSTYINSMREDDHTKGNATTYAAFAKNNPSRWLRVTLTIKKEVTLTNQGTLVVSGNLSGGTSNVCSMGQTSHSYSEILLEEGAKIVQDTNSTEYTPETYCFGFISESSKNNNSSCQFKKGNIYVPFVVNDFRGIDFSWAMTDGAIDDKRCSPFNQFELQNISVFSEFNYDSTVYGVINLYIDYRNAYQGTSPKTMKILASSNDALIQFNSNTSSLDYYYDPSSDVADLYFYGGVTLNNLEMTFSVVFEGINREVNLSTKNAFFPVSYHQRIHLLSSKSETSPSENVVYNLSKQRMKFLPGSYLEVGSNVQLNALDIVVYSAFYDGSLGSASFIGNCAYSAKAYPRKPGAEFIVQEGGFLTVNNLAGVVYGNEENITVEGNTSICANEAWKNVNNPSLIPIPVTIINTYLELYETLDIRPLTDYHRPKIYVGINNFYKDDTTQYFPAFNIITDSENVFSFNKNQGVIFLDSPENYSIEFLSNISNFISNSTRYQKDSIISYNSSGTNSVCSIPSAMSISSDNNGINEFEIQSLSIRSLSPTLPDGKDPLYVGKNISLVADVIDAEKAYDKTIVWESSNPEVATINQSGVVTGVSFGEVEITASIGGVTAVYKTEVLEEQEVKEIEKVVIVDNQGHRSDVVAGNDFKDDNFIEGNPYTKDYHAQYESGDAVIFSIEIYPSDAVYSQITWSLDKTATDRQWIDKNNTSDPEIVSGIDSVTVTFGGNTGSGDDEPHLNVKVVGLDSTNVVEAQFVINHKRSSCLLPNTKITMADGSVKLAKDLKQGDSLLTYNHTKGCFEAQKILANVVFEEQLFDIVTLTFNDGSILTIASGHGLFNLNRHRYEIYYGDEFMDHLGEEFVAVKKVEGTFTLKKVVLVDVKVKQEKTIKVSPVSEYNINCATDDLLTIPDDIEGMFDDFKYSSFETGLKIDVEDFASKVEKYGVYKEDELSSVIHGYLFKVLNFQYFKTFIGMGLISYEKVNYWLKKYAKPMYEYQKIPFDWTQWEPLSDKF